MSPLIGLFYFLQYGLLVLCLIGTPVAQVRISLSFLQFSLSRIQCCQQSSSCLMYLPRPLLLVFSLGKCSRPCVQSIERNSTWTFCC